MENTYRQVTATIRVIDNASGVSTVTMDGVGATLDVDDKYKRLHQRLRWLAHIECNGNRQLGNTTNTSVTYNFFCTIADLCY